MLLVLACFILIGTQGREVQLQLVMGMSGAAPQKGRVKSVS